MMQASSRVACTQCMVLRKRGERGGAGVPTHGRAGSICSTLSKVLFGGEQYNDANLFRRRQRRYSCCVQTRLGRCSGGIVHQDAHGH